MKNLALAAFAALTLATHGARADTCAARASHSEYGAPTTSRCMARTAIRPASPRIVATGR
jgi:hypothetical protein